ncbi:hypothetical protein Back11_32250 [Paenibacillus baekrokdamisoli]|uniref:Uncharacterized protein n=1 Tax=Paenibacillus baekrokdamisoli TaxID=1712516 RepID=A0A3G9ISP9_9BACL|nr:hypothetical protein [Paenibacillus baekrokdamisoli]BBH21880.1 hypothetical protein Back11_32250 [Paenibacillus baekrokdamisoli]
MKIVYLIVALMIMLLGFIHICIAPRIHKSMTQESMWFVSGGLALISNAIINLVMINVKLESSSMKYLCQGNNVLTLIFSLILVRVLPRPQTKLFVFLMFLETLLGF